MLVFPPSISAATVALLGTSAVPHSAGILQSWLPPCQTYVAVGDCAEAVVAKPRQAVLANQKRRVCLRDRGRRLSFMNG